MDMTQGRKQRETSAAETPAMVPAVDVIENEGGIVVKADLPGISREGLQIRVDGETLTIEGQVSLGENQGLDPVYAEIRTAQYKRSFILSRDLDTSKIDASMKNGVLTLKVPKLEQAKPRRISVRAE
ncbi:MAG TPA: Hsp20/alpha crystallin family protein [Usitatibacter sp.]|nr:Hsp20/alpha crystallin family protein [Usitatibacter sp.]